MLAGVEDRPPPSRAMGIDERAHLGLDPFAGEGGHNQISLPVQIGRRRPVLQQAATAHAEMAALGSHAVRTGSMNALHHEPVLFRPAPYRSHGSV